MSNYDDILRKKEQEDLLPAGAAAQHWNAMEQMMNPSASATAAKGAIVILISITKILLITGVIATLSYWVYQQFSKTKKEFNGVLKPSNIHSQFFTIDNNKDEKIITSHASVLKIKKGTFKTDKPVTIEVKEVFTPAEILQSGLTTLSNGKPLRSAGMLYFNASAGGETIEPAIPIDAFVPTKDADPDMQIFKGEIQDDSTVNWVEPAAIADTTWPGDAGAGRVIFRNKCASCHDVLISRTGPSLKNFQYRGPWRNPANIRRFINNPAAFMATDKYTQDLKAKYGSLMTAFPELTDKDVINILTYLNEVKEDEMGDKETETEGVIKDSTGIFDSPADCGNDTTYYSIENDFEEYDTAGYVDLAAINSYSNSDTAVFDYSEYEGVYRQGYDFQITNNGWYNIDAFLKTERNDTEEVLLSAEIVNGESLPYNVYVFVPSERVLQTYSTKKGNEYRFTFGNDKIPLPLRYRAVILAFGSSGQKIIYGAADFVIKSEQHIKIELKETTKEGLLNVLYTKNINGVSIEAIEKEMSIGPKPCPDTKAIAPDTVKVPRQMEFNPK